MRTVRIYTSKDQVKANERLIKVMKERNITSRAICEELGLHEMDFSAIRRGVYFPSWKEANDIAKILNSDPIFLFPDYANVPDDLKPFVCLPRRARRKDAKNNIS